LVSLAAPFVAATITSCYTEHKIETTSKVDTTHKIELEVKPMYIKIDVNLKVDKELDNFFDDLDDQDATMTKDKKKTEGEAKK